MKLTMNRVGKAAGQTQNMELYIPPFYEDQLPPARIVPPRADAETMLAEDKERYAEHISIPHYRKQMLMLPGTDAMVDPYNLNLNVTTSYHLQAIKKDVARTLTPISMEGLIVTADNKLVWGVRGGQVENGIAHLSPAGNLTYEENHQHPLFRFFYDEARKELGITPGKLRNPVLLGHQDSPVIKGVGFLLVAETTETFQEIYDRHQASFGEYKAAKASGLEELAARAKITGPNEDAWEHVKLFPIENSVGAIERILRDSERKIEVDGYRLNTVDCGQGSLYLHAEAMRLS